MSTGAPSPTKLRDWLHSPVHRLSDTGTYMVTSGTYQKRPLFQDPASLSDLTNLLMDTAEKYGWNLQAWAVFPNHYHFIGDSEKGRTLKRFIQEFHSKTAANRNRIDGTPGRKVWFQTGILK